MMETDKETGVKRQVMPITHFSAVLGLDDFLKGNLFQAEFERVMAQLIEHYDRVSENIDSKSKEIEEHADQKIAEFDKKVVGTEAAIKKVETDLAETKEVFDSLDVFNKQESSANVIYQLVGKEKVRLDFSLHLKDKIAGSNIENSNLYRYISMPTSTFPSNSDSWIELDNSGSWKDYSKVAEVDNNLFTTSTTLKNVVPYHEIVWDILGAVKKELGENFFTAIGAVTDEEQSILVKNMLKGDTHASFYGTGKGPSGNLLTTKCFDGSGWYYERTSTQSKITKIVASLPASAMKHYINSQGKFFQIAYSEASDGLTQSVVNVDCTTLDFSIEISAKEYFELMMAAYCGGLNEISFEKVGEV